VEFTHKRRRAQSGPAGAWTYDLIGNRLTETRDGVLDDYDYEPGASGNTPILDVVDLDTTGLGGQRDYTFGLAGHLGAPLLATDATGNDLWAGPLEPFGKDFFQQAQSSDVFLRLPGQWDDPLWQNPTAGVGIYYNVHRWYEAGTGRYARPDPLPLKPAPLPYVHTASRPTFFTDTLGLAPIHNGSPYPVPYKPEDDDEFRLCLPGEDCDADGVYPLTCLDFPVKIVGGCNGKIGADGRIRIYCPFFNPDAPGLKRKFPRFGQRIIGGRTSRDFHNENGDWPVPNGAPFCGCKPPPGSQLPPVP